MKLESSLQQRQELRLISYQSLEILQLPLLELQTTVDQELLQNPTLEMKGEIEDPQPVPEQDPAEKETEQPDADEDFGQIGQVGDDLRDYIYNGSQRSRSYSDEDTKMEAMANAPARLGTLQDYLHYQLMLSDLTDERLREFATYIIYNIDDNGYLRFPFEEIRFSFNTEAAKTSGDGGLVSSPVSHEEASRVLSAVQGFDPSGVAARDLKECLILQLDTHEADYEVKRSIINFHLEDISQKNNARIAKELSLPQDEVDILVDEISKLNPHPGAAYDSQPVPFVVPDVIVEKEQDGRYSVRLEKSYSPVLRINMGYKNILRDRASTPDVKDFIRNKLNSARNLILAIKQRENTILKMAGEIVVVQRAFLDDGPSKLAPLRMQDVADKIGVNISTVSRTVANKYMLTPQGIFGMRYFFAGGTSLVTGTTSEDISRNRIISMMNEIIAVEGKGEPLSDADLAKKLNEKGLVISRRTVTKYRKLANIPSTRKRKS